MSPRFWTALENGMSLWHIVKKKDQFQEPIRRISVLSSFISVLSSFNWFTLNYPDHHIWSAGFNGLCQSESFRKRIRFVQFSIIHKHLMRDKSGDWLHQKEAEYTKWKELVPGKSPGGPHMLMVKERIVFRSQLLLVSCLTAWTDERQMKITVTKSVLRWVRNIMIDSAEGSAYQKS